MDFDESLARLGADEASKTKHLLRDLELNLYTPANPTPLSEEYRSEPACEYSRGYDAHVESVNSKEICLWQHQFHYLGITGVSSTQTTYPAPENFDEISNIGEEESNSTKDRPCPNVDDDFTRMKIIGKKLDIQSLPLPEDGDEGETFASDGVLEEYFAYDNSGNMIPVSTDNGSSDMFSSIDPSESGQAEVINGLLDAIFPDLCAALEPLVHRVVSVGRKHGVSYVEENCEEEEGGGFFDSDDDDRGNGFFVNQDGW